MKLMLMAAALLIAAASFSQTEATTKSGRKVLLNDDGTWTYTDKDAKSVAASDTVLKVYTKPAISKKLLKSKRNDFGFWYDESKWSLADYKVSDVNEYLLKLKGEDGYFLTVSEQMQIPLEMFKSVVLQNVKIKGGTVTVKKEEYRLVNGVKVLYIEFDAEVQGINFSYFGYYTSNESGSVQHLCYTGRNLAKKMEPEFMKLLNGTVAIPEESKENK